MTASTFYPEDKKICLYLSLLYMIRMLGLFIILPIFALYAPFLQGQTPLLMGLLFSSYALMQIIFQPIFGLASDYIGRKPIIIFGLCLFSVGSIVLAMSTDIYGALWGRILQGSGAISAAVLALATDLTRPSIRTKIMAIIGVSIGITFGIAMFLGSFLMGFIGSRGIFYSCALLGVIGMMICWLLPSPIAVQKNALPRPPMHLTILFQTNLWRLYLGALLLHTGLTALFMVIPFSLLNTGLANNQHWYLYVPSFVLSLLMMGYMINRAEKNARLKPLFLMAIACLVIAFGQFIWAEAKMGFFIGLCLFFVGFNIMEAMQPSLMARFSPVMIRGTTMGIFASAQFLGAAMGGMIGGLALGYQVVPWLFIILALMMTVWFILALGMDDPHQMSQSVIESDQ